MQFPFSYLIMPITSSHFPLHSLSFSRSCIVIVDVWHFPYMETHLDLGFKGDGGLLLIHTLYKINLKYFCDDFDMQLDSYFSKSP